MMKVIVTGSLGMLGSELVSYLKANGFEVIGWDLPEWDITDKEKVIKGIIEKRPEAIIHLAAFTDVDRAEEEREKAYQVNVLGTTNLVIGAKAVAAKFLYLSTDYVFDGKKEVPYREEEQPNPINYYGETKYLGELEVKKWKRHFIVRTAWLFSRKGKNFVNTIKAKVEKNEEIRVVDDQIGSPTYTKDLLMPIRDLVRTEFYGIYHITNSGFCSWFQFASEIVKILRVNREIKPIRTEEAGRLAKRPRFSVLANYNYQKTFGRELRNWVEALGECLTKSEPD